MLQRLTKFFSTAIVMGVIMVSLANAAPAGTQKSGMSTAQPIEFTGTVSTVDKGYVRDTGSCCALHDSVSRTYPYQAFIAVDPPTPLELRLDTSRDVIPARLWRAPSGDGDIPSCASHRHVATTT